MIRYHRRFALFSFLFFSLLIFFC